MVPQPSTLLTTGDRVRLRPSVDITALERFLAAAPDGFRRFYYLVCVKDLSEAEAHSLGAELATFPPGLRHRNAGRLLDPGSELESLWKDVESPESRGA
jgi:hypothetical protein